MDSRNGPDPALSVLIPVYMRDIGPLIDLLSAEMGIMAGECPVELRIADDCSPDRALEERNRKAAERVPGTTYEALPRNVGRSAIRNHLGQHARGRHLVFMDCDTLPDSPRFLRSYLDAFRQGGEVVCGGISYIQATDPKAEERFYLYVSSRNDVKPADDRNRNPSKHLLTGNVGISKSIFDAFPFDTSFTGHGYEDVEWALRISQKHRITHIDNTVSHLGLIPCRHFIDRTALSTDNYVRLAKKHWDAFSRSAIARMARSLRWIPAWALRSSGRALQNIAGWNCLPMRMRYYSFQGMKCLYFAAQSRTAA